MGGILPRFAQWHVRRAPNDQARRAGYGHKVKIFTRAAGPRSLNAAPTRQPNRCRAIGSLLEHHGRDLNPIALDVDPPNEPR
jgi:hypothetical protein